MNRADGHVLVWVEGYNRAAQVCMPKRPCSPVVQSGGGGIWAQSPSLVCETSLSRVLLRGEVGVCYNNAALNVHTHNPNVRAHPSLIVEPLWEFGRALTHSHGHLSGSCWPTNLTEKNLNHLLRNTDTTRNQPVREKHSCWVYKFWSSKCLKNEWIKHTYLGLLPVQTEGRSIIHRSKWAGNRNREK